MNEYQNTNEKELNMSELLIYCLKQWRWLLISMIAAGILAGGYKYMSIQKTNEALLLTSEGGAEEKEEEAAVQNLVDEYELAIEKNREDLQNQEEYLKDSVLMQLDGNHLAMGILNFYLELGDTEGTTNELDSLLSVYRGFIQDGRLARELAEIEGSEISFSDLQWLISWVDNRSNSNETTFEATWPTQGVVTIRIGAENEIVCEKYLERAKEAILEYGRELHGMVPEHELKLLPSSQGELVNQSVLNYQKQMLANYTTTVRNLQTFQTELEKIREAEAEAKAESSDSSALKSIVLINPLSGAIKFAVIGMALGVFFAMSIAAMAYIVSGKLQSLEHFEREFGMRLVGRISNIAEKKATAIDRLIYRLGEGGYAGVPYEEQVKIALANVKVAASGLQKIMLAGTIAKDDAEKFCSYLNKEINEIEFSEYNQIIFCAAALEEMGKYDGVLFLEKRGVSAVKMMKEEKELTENRQIKVLGVVVID